VILATTEFAPFRGGLASYAESLASGLMAAGRAVHVLAPRYPDLGEGASVVEGHVRRYRLWSASAPLRRRWVLARTLLRGVHGADAAVVIAVTYLYAQVCALVLILRPRRFRLVVTVCGPELSPGAWWRPREWWRRLIIRLVKRTSHRIICISEFSRRLAVQAGFPDGQLRVVYVGVDTTYFRPMPDAASWREKLLQGSPGPILLTTGRLERRKGHDVALEAVGVLREKYPRLQYVVIGVGEEEDRLRKIVAQRGLDAHVVFRGRVSRDELRRAYGGSDVFLFPTRQEGSAVEAQGLAVIEAGLCGLPVVVGRHGGVLEIVSHERTGLIIDPRDPRAAAEAVDRLLIDTALRERLAKEAREEWSRRFSQATMVHATEVAMDDD
jgi:glycosyltransferase involved in cell wall biosynthesis